MLDTFQPIPPMDRFPGAPYTPDDTDGMDITTEQKQILHDALEQLATDLDQARQEFEFMVQEFLEMPCDHPPEKFLPKSSLSHGTMDEGDLYHEIGRLVRFCELLKEKVK